MKEKVSSTGSAIEGDGKSDKRKETKMFKG